MSKEMDRKVEKVTIKFCNDIIIGINKDFESNVSILKGVLVQFLGNWGVLIPKDLNMANRIKHDIRIPFTNIASYWVWKAEESETLEVSTAA